MLFRSLSVRSSQVTLAMHGQPNGVDAREFLVRFVRATPTGLGENLGAGVVFYFGERPPLTFSSVSADLSGVYPGKMFVKLHAAFGGTMAPQSVRATTEDHFRAALAGIGLTLGENQGCS